MDDIFRRLQVLLNGLDAQINLKILDSFPKVRVSKTTTIQEARNLKTLAWDELLGILRVHEVHLQIKDHFPKRNFVALKTGETSSRHEERKNLSRALNVHMNESDASDNNSEVSTNDKVALISRKFKQMLKTKGKFQHSSKQKGTRFKKKHREENNEIVCFECKKPSDIKVEYPQLKRKRYIGDKKNKSFLVTWDDSNNEKSINSDDE